MEAEVVAQHKELPRGSQDQFSYTLGVNFYDPSWWCTVFIFFFEPIQRSMLACKANSGNTRSFWIGTQLMFRVYCIASYAFSILMCIVFHRVLNVQPRLRDLQRNEALMFGYLFILVGLCIKIHTYKNNTLASIMGGQYFGIDVQRKTGAVYAFDPYYHPLGTSSVMCYFGLSLIRASTAGIIITGALGIGLCLASHTERFYLSRKTNQRLHQHKPASIPDPLGGSRNKDEKDS